MILPKGRLQIWRRVCQVSASYHINAITPSSTADAPKTIRPYIAVFIQTRYNVDDVRLRVYGYEQWKQKAALANANAAIRE